MRSLTDRLVPGWQRAWRWGSVWMHAIGTLVASLLLLVPAMPLEIQALVPVKWRALAIAAWFAAGLYVRLTQKPKGGANAQG